MKKHVKKNRNKKGSVLLTVVCFTLVCMIIASTALSLASYSAKNSNNNVRSTQAEISAQNFLQEYINSFPDTGDDTRFNALSTLAGSDANHPNEISAKLKDSAGNDVTSVSTDAKIKIYKSGSGIVVRSEVNSNGETEVASAYFDGKATNPYISTNVIETRDGMTGYDKALSCSGDTLIEGKPDDLVSLHNTQSEQWGNIITNSNLLAGNNTQVYIKESVDQKSPKVISKGYIFWGGAIMATTNDSYKKTLPITSGTPADDGYVLTNSKFVNLGIGDIGSVGKIDSPIDVYCKGAYFGKPPTSELDSMKSIFDNARVDTNPLTYTNPVAPIYGNFYCQKGSERLQDGNLYVNTNKAVINGDLVVDGYIYLYPSSSLKVTGTVYCKTDGGIVCVNHDGTTDNSTSINDRLDSTNIIYGSPTGSDDIARAQTPTGYDFSSGTKITDRYVNVTPNIIYKNSQSSDLDTKKKNIYLSDNYKSAYDSVNAKDASGSWIENYWMYHIYVKDDFSLSVHDVYVNEANSNTETLKNLLKNTYDYKLYINDHFSFGKEESSTKTVREILGALYGGFDQLKRVKITIKIPRKDIVILLPETSTQLNICVDYSKCAKTAPVAGDALRTEATPENFCYFMLECGENADRYSSEETDPDTTGWNSWNFYETKIIDCTRYPGGTTSTEFENGSKKVSANNNFILIPNGCKVALKSQNQNCIQAILYGPEAYVNAVGTGSSYRVFLGQAICKSFEITENATNVGTLLPSPGSFLDDLINNSTPENALKLQYFIKSKK